MALVISCVAHCLKAWCQALRQPCSHLMLLLQLALIIRHKCHHSIMSHCAHTSLPSVIAIQWSIMLMPVCRVCLMIFSSLYNAIIFSSTFSWPFFRWNWAWCFLFSFLTEHCGTEMCYGTENVWVTLLRRTVVPSAYSRRASCCEQRHLYVFKLCLNKIL